MSFRPEVVNDTLFFLSTKTATATDAAQATPGLTPTVTPIVTPATTPTLSNAAIKPRLDPTIYPPQLDEAVRGTLLSVPLDDDTVQPLSTESDDWSSVPQAGTRFLLWQSDKGYEMYDVVAKSAVTIGAGTVPNDALFLAVNGDTAVWIVSSDNSTDKADTSSTDSPVTFRVFNWPTKA
jgi:hypothetical protein